MYSLPPSDLKSVRLELNRLYERRRIVDELIQSLERYAACDSTPTVVDTAGNVATIDRISFVPQ